MDRKIFVIFVFSTIGIFSPTFGSEESMALKGCRGSNVTSADTLSITLGKKKKKGKMVYNVEQVKVKWQPDIEKNKQTFDAYDLDTLKLYIRPDGGDWKASKSQGKFHGYYKWDVPRVPCLSYTFKVLVTSKADSNTFLCTAEKSIEPVSKDKIRTAKFIPDPPTDMTMDIASNHANFRWNKSQCAEEYEVYVIGESNEFEDAEQSVTVDQSDGKDGGQARLKDFKSCTPYQIQVYSKLNGVDAGEEGLVKSFQTKPDKDSASNLDLTDVESTASSATLRFRTYQDKVNCLKNFTVETCEKNSKNRCSHRKTFVITQNHEELIYTSNGLEHCTNYFLNVQPSYPGVEIEPKKVDIATKFDETKKIVPSIQPKFHGAKIMMNETVCIDSYAITYGIVGGTNETYPGLKEKKGKMGKKMIEIAQLQENSTYQVNMTITLESGKNLTVLEKKEFRTLEKEPTTQWMEIISTTTDQPASQADKVTVDSRIEHSGNDVSTTAKIDEVEGSGSSKSTTVEVGQRNQPLEDKSTTQSSPQTKTGGGEWVVIVIVIVVLLLGAGIGFVVIRKRQSGNEKDEAVIENQKYKEVPQNDMQADNTPQ